MPSRMPRIAVDAMGGDFGPQVVIPVFYRPPAPNGRP
jgi:fatty acid/phospholipid biosynthesis enzyme